MVFGRNKRHPFYFVLNEAHQPVPCANVQEYLEQMIRDERIVVGKDVVNGIEISTVFIGINSQPDPAYPPLLFETMCFTEIEAFGLQLRYPTWEEAEQGHRVVVEAMHRVLPVPPSPPEQ